MMTGSDESINIESKNWSRIVLSCLPCRVEVPLNESEFGELKIGSVFFETFIAVMIDTESLKLLRHQREE